jgi:hypothetical protein
MTAPSIFLSHNHEDKSFARALASDLRRGGIVVWLDEAEIRLGDSIIGKIEEGLLGSEYLGVVLSPSSVASQWVKEELCTALHYQITKKNKTVLPLMYKPCDVPAFLADKLYADFSKADSYPFVLRQLLSRLDPRFDPPNFVSNAELQELVDRVPTPPSRGSILSARIEDDVDFVTSNAIDISELNAAVAWPNPKVVSALRELIGQHKVEIFLFKGTIGAGHPNIQAGSPFVLPLVFKGLLPPALRSSPSEIESLLLRLERK